MDSTSLSTAENVSPAERGTTSAAALAALGIVYGDLGTSPLYTYQAIVGSVGSHPNAQDALGLLSLVIWALILTVSIKYCVFVMRADNHGEGGILALMALVTGRAGRSTRGPDYCRPVRRCPDLWRWHHHTGDLGFKCLRRHQRPHRRVQALCGAGGARRPARPFYGPNKRHSQHRQNFRPCHASLVHRHRRARPVWHAASA